MIMVLVTVILTTKSVCLTAMFCLCVCVFAAYVPRSQRNALSTSDINTSSLSSSTGLSRSASLRSRLRNGETESTPEDDRKKEETKESRKECKKVIVVF